MKVSLINIGNSRGIRAPKAILEQVGFADEAELSVEDGRIVLTPSRSPRTGWAEAYAAAPAELGEEDQVWLEATLTDEDPEEEVRGLDSAAQPRAGR